MTKTIFLFPNTGHHYYFLPLSLPSGTAAAGIKNFEDDEEVTLPKGNSAGKVETLASQAQWKEADQARWLRWRYGARTYKSKASEIRVFGIWIAVETNLGGRDRGYVWDVDRNPQQDDPAWTAFRERQAQGLDDVTPYYRTGSFRMPKNQILNLIEMLGLRRDLPDLASLELEIVWPERGGDVIPVHLVVDFGNSRTIVLALEERPVVAEGSLRQICRPIQFGSSLEDAGKIRFLGSTLEEAPNPADRAPESWFVLREPPFAGEQFQPEHVTMDQFFVSEQHIEETGFFGRGRSTVHTSLDQIVRRVPQMFVELSPAVIGPEASQTLASASKSLAYGGRCYLSSPKRYAWDTDRVGTGGGAHWTMLPGTGRPGGQHGLPQRLAGEMLRFLPEQQARRPIEDPTLDPPPVEWEELEEHPDSKPKQPNFSRADSLIWTALSILEHAAQQISSEAFRRNFQFTIPRRIASITVTRPSGWTRGEIRAYWAAWREARNIFFWSREPYGDDAPPYPEWTGRKPYPEVDMLLDEGVASQLALVYSEIRHLGARGRDWIALFGRRRGDSDSIRVMTIDIGGGSTDTSVVEYRDSIKEGVGSELTPKVLLNDSTAFAGDRLALDLIERILLPTIGARFKDKPELNRKFCEALVANDEADKVRMALITRTVFMPIIHKWFEDIEQGRRGDASEKKRWTPEESGANAERVVDFSARMERAGLGSGLLQGKEPFPVDYDAVERIIGEWARRIADLHARILAAYSCDLVVVAGKPSELPQVKELLKERLPIELHRLLFAHSYFAGDWFPCTSSDYAISDAKMVTVAGAALYTAINCDARRQTAGDNENNHGPLLHHFRMHDITEHQEPARNFWGRIGMERRPFRSTDVFLQVDKDTTEVIELGDHTMIGRARFPGQELEPIYEFRIKKSGLKGPVRARLKRVSTDGDHNLPSEELAIVPERSANGVVVTPDDVELKLRTLPSRQEHWFDRGSFEVRW
jgi:hypothetical protein